MAVTARTLTSLLLYLAAFYATDATITWSTPSGGDGTANVDENAAVGAAVETIAATSDDNLGDFTLLTTGTPFTLAVGGALTVASATLDFETTPTYTLSIKGVDDSTSATATLTVHVNDAPTFSSSTFSTCATDGSVAGGNTGTDFTISSDKIVTANALAMTTTASYDLIVQVSDTSLTASATVTVSVSASYNSATALVFSLLTILTALVVALN